MHGCGHASLQCCKFLEIESKSVFVSERGLTSVQWTEYSEHTKRVQYSTVPTSSITSEVVMVDGFALSQKDTAGVATTFTRSYTVNGMVLTQTDGRGNNGECDHMGRRAIKRVMVNGNVTLHQRYIYRGYLQIACIDLTRSHHPALWYITWDPTQNIATRPLAIQKDGTWYTYGWDLTKNICEVYSSSGYIRTSYTYAPYSEVSSTGNVEQPNQWSSEFNDTELGLIYYNYRHYNPVDGRWTGRDPEESTNLMSFSLNTPTVNVDILGRRPNINLLPRKKVANSDKTEYELAEANINYSSYFVIVAHGNPNWIADADKIVYDAKYLAHLMIQRGYKYDKHVLLIACETGQRFAQHLANELENRRKKDNKCSKSKIFVYAPMRKTQIKFDEDQRQIELYQERMHISIIGEKYEYINGMKIVLPQIGVSYKYDLKAELYKFTPNTK